MAIKGNLSEKYQNIFHRNPLFVGMRVPFAKEIDPLDKRLAKVSKLTLGFIKSCLRIDANDRPTSSALLRSEYFTSENFASIFLEELKTLIKNETNSNVPSSSTNITSNKNTVNNLNNNNNQTQVKNDQQCKISNNNSNFVQSKVSNTTATTMTPTITYITTSTTTTTTTTTGNTCTDTSTTTTTAVKHFLSDIMNMKNPNKEKAITPDHVDLSVTSQTGLHNSEINEIYDTVSTFIKEWISIETLDKIKKRKNKEAAINNSRTRAEKVQGQTEYTEANKQVKRSIRADKKKYVEELATTAEKAAREGNMKQLYDTTKKLSGKYNKPERPVKDKQGKPIAETQQQRNRWVEYFEELLNRPAPMNPPEIEAAHTDLPIDVNPTTKEEIRMAVRQIKNGKATGPDNVPAEALKSDIEITTNMLYLLFKKIWEEEHVGILRKISQKLFY
ncbi:unnamed protein product [Schistosoma margrebowiei]|uniref:Uncharacterized protein n=1 Tax=Schistosoma margrebowiei TaxID=48269 RepID=A0A183M748_9TREM|nr:unnamed protein product [Schistosoma margrebowiei]